MQVVATQHCEHAMLNARLSLPREFISAYRVLLQAAVQCLATRAMLDSHRTKLRAMLISLLTWPPIDYDNNGNLMMPCSAHGVLRRYCLMIKAWPLKHPHCWGITFQADVRMRSERMPRIPAKLKSL